MEDILKQFHDAIERLDEHGTNFVDFLFTRDELVTICEALEETKGNGNADSR